MMKLSGFVLIFNDRATRVLFFPTQRRGRLSSGLSLSRPLRKARPAIVLKFNELLSSFLSPFLSIIITQLVTPVREANDKHTRIVVRTHVVEAGPEHGFLRLPRPPSRPFRRVSTLEEEVFNDV
jgi:hypothetical protein